ncbi:DJ-1/PfpI family protein [Massilia sp. SM-13]|uniref:DJ-1/PfpI family protein n=1 Tax=Pseudoduganella rhizocola TaxID=3382643 RepID=UPI0038B4D874
MPVLKTGAVLCLLLSTFLVLAHARGRNEAAPAARLDSGAVPQQLPPYQNRFGRERPVVAVIGENGGTEMTDFIIPYSILSDADVAEVHALGIRPGPVIMRPTTLQLMPSASAADFDTRYPEGADYVIVPAVVQRRDPALLAWIAAQGHKGATIVSICDGGLVVAQSGLLKGRRATAHWFTEDIRQTEYPDTQWLKNQRYVVDGSLVSSAGISAALPTSIALVEAIAGTERARRVASRYGISDWSARHNSEMFIPRFGVNLRAYAATFYLNGWFHRNEAVGVPVDSGVDDVALALTMDAFSRTGRSQAYALAPGTSFRTRNGLTFAAPKPASPPQRLLPAVPDAPAEDPFDSVLDRIETAYGSATADGVAYAFEYARKRR